MVLKVFAIHCNLGIRTRTLFSELPKLPQGQGFDANTNINRDGNFKACLARKTLIFPSSIG